MERDRRRLYPFLPDRFQQGIGEVETRSGCCSGAPGLRIDRLIPRPVFRFKRLIHEFRTIAFFYFSPLQDIGRKRNLSPLFQKGVDILILI